ncbi:early activation antigen CD69-like isoform X1 [Gymnogyps californianus]|uniref:early activation antigen CD69-like isoform X1 n=2 Tax=Gymnogyps californianus TaxID=33616 RepID=UPI0021C842DB|nr:early activation antigen CD69-like isoform X1 [Gymnogyps californianus]
MLSAIFHYDRNSCADKTAFKPGLKLNLPAVVMPWMQDPTCCKQRDSSFPCAVGQGEGNGFWCSDGNVEEPLDPHDGGASPHPGVPRDADKRTARRLLGEWCALHPACILVLAVLMVVILALAAALAVQSAGRHGSNPDLPAAPVLACPEFWVGYRNVCYYLSREEGSWEWSQEQCSLRGASLAVLRREWEMEFLSRLKGNADCWLGLWRRGERVEWVDGSSFNNTFPVHGKDRCLFLDNSDFRSSSCSQHHPFICSKPQALM